MVTLPKAPVYALVQLDAVALPDDEKETSL